MSLTNKKYESGASLLEVMISLFVLGVGILGVLAMQAQALRINGQAYNYSKAVFLANDIAERMRNNLNGLEHYTSAGTIDKSKKADSGFGGTTCYGSGGETTCVDANGRVNPEELAKADIEQWATNLANSLPNVSAVITEVDEVADPIKDGTGDDANIVYANKVFKIEITFSTVELDGVTISGNTDDKETYTLVTGV